MLEPSWDQPCQVKRELAAKVNRCDQDTAIKVARRLYGENELLKSIPPLASRSNFSAYDYAQLYGAAPPLILQRLFAWLCSAHSRACEKTLKKSELF